MFIQDREFFHSLRGELPPDFTPRTVEQPGESWIEPMKRERSYTNGGTFARQGGEKPNDLNNQGPAFHAGFDDATARMRAEHYRTDYHGWRAFYTVRPQSSI